MIWREQRNKSYFSKFRQGGIKMQTQLLGQPVRHASFGSGVITDISSEVVTIFFSEGEKKFRYPDAFSKFLTLIDDAKQEAVKAKYSKKVRSEEAARTKELEKAARFRKIRTMKISANSQAAFDIDFSEADSLIKNGVISTGCYLSGCSKGKPRIPNRMNPNSACLLTGLAEGKKEKDRLILGIVMLKDDFWGEDCRDGMLKFHDEYRILLPPEARLPYWDYFKHHKTAPSWGRVAFKYLENTAMQTILLDMVRALEGTRQESAAREFCEYFCAVNRLPVQ